MRAINVLSRAEHEGFLQSLSQICPQIRREKKEGERNRERERERERERDGKKERKIS